MVDINPTCTDRKFMVANFEFLAVDGTPTSEPHPHGFRMGRSQTIRIDGSGADRHADVQPPHRVVEKDGNIIFERHNPG